MTGTKTAAFEKKCVLVDTAPKTNMESENDHWEKERHLYIHNTKQYQLLDSTNKMDIKNDHI